MDDAAEGIAKPALPAWDGSDGLSSSAVLSWLQDAFFLPGDWLIWAIASYLTPVAELIGIGADDYGGAVSAAVSTCAWSLVVIVIAITIQWIRDADRAATRAIVDGYGNFLRRIRIATALVKTAIRRRTRRSAPGVDVPVEVPLTPIELRALQLHGQLEPGYALGVSEVASALNARKHQAAQILERLRLLGLLANTIGSSDGESAYTLTRAGRAFLMFRQMGRKQHAVRGAVEPS